MLSEGLKGILMRIKHLNQNFKEFSIWNKIFLVSYNVISKLTMLQLCKIRLLTLS